LRLLRRALGDWGWRLAIAVAVAVGLIVIYTRPPTPDDLLTRDPPGPPDLLADHAERDCRDFEGDPDGVICGAFLQRGAEVGATPNTAIARPQAYLGGIGIKYNYYQSVNWSGRGFHPIEGLVLHVTGAGTCPGMRAWFQNPLASASAHFGICKDGSIEQYVELADASWHAGILNRPDTRVGLVKRFVDLGINPNSRTVGIEVLLAPGERLEDYPAMRNSLHWLLTYLLREFQIPASNVLGHYHIDSVNRAVDPRCCYDIAEELAFVPGAAAPIPESCGNPCWNDARWIFEDGWSFEPATGAWFNPQGLHEWTACNVDRLRWHPQIESWFPEGHGFFHPPRGFWSFAPLC